LPVGTPFPDSKVAYTYKYDLSSFGKRVVAAGLHLKTFVLTSQLCATAPG
jgi:hypothetical protein